MGTHALLSPSSADRWMTCLGSVALCKDLPEDESPYAQEGTNYHTLAQICLEQGKDASEFVGSPFEDETEVTEENAEYVQTYIDLVRELQAQGGTLAVEDKLPISPITGEKDAFGTSDATLIREDEVVVADLKFGRGVAVKAENNRQAKLYAIAAIEKHGLWDDVKQARLIICQPRVMDGTSESVVPARELKMFRDEVHTTARVILRALETGEQLPLVPSEKACRFCKAAKAGICTALTQTVEQATAEGFENLDEPTTKVAPTGKTVEVPGADRLGEAMKLADLAEIWIKGVRAKVEAELLAGRSVTGFKLVQGRKGPRKWDDKAAIEEALKKKRVKHEEMYDYTLISPTTAEKRWKKAKPGWWKELSEHVKQSDGALSVAPMEDPRPQAELEPAESGFEVVEEDFSDLAG